MAFRLVLCVMMLCTSFPLKAEAGKVLFMHPMFSPSHVHALRTLALNLTSRGHSVTVVRVETAIPPLLPQTNITEIILQTDNSDGRIPLLTREKQARFAMPENTWEVGEKFNSLPLEGLITIASFCKTLLGDTDLQQQLREEHFDVAVVDLIYNECSLGLTHKLGIPSVGYWALSFVGYQPLYTAAYNPPSTVPYVYSRIKDTTAFVDRLWNYLLHIYSQFLMELLFLVENYHMSRLIPGVPSAGALLGNLSGVLINTHPSVDCPRQLPPTFMEVGGFHIKEPEPLPKDLEAFLSGAGSRGAVLFSLGCTFHTDLVPANVVQNYMNAFARLPHRVVMRAMGKLPFVPPNVMVVDWLPQNDILAHPQTVLFVSHCGMHGVMEAIKYRVPMVGIPIFADQFDVLVRLQEKGVIVGTSKDADEDTLLAVMLEAINNKTYASRMADLSRAVDHYRPQPLESAVWLLEHVMMTKGADHLKMRTQHLNRFQYLSLDVITFYLLALATTLYVSYRLVSRIDLYRPFPSKLKWN